MWTSFEDIPVHGDIIRDKPEDVTRVFFENVDGFRVDTSRPARGNNNKLKFFNNLLSRLQVDVVAGAESRTNWSLLPRNFSLTQLLDQREGSRCIVAHNEHERFSLCQQGGTFMAATPLLNDLSPSVGKDSTGLGRWCWIKVGSAQCCTRIITAYQPCNTRKRAQSATIAQQRRYWLRMRDTRNPRIIFREQLITLLTEWREAGEKLILLLDSNEDMSNGSLARKLTGEDLQMTDAVHARSGCEGPPTFVRGRRQIDGAWVTPDISIRGACFLPFYFGIGDHRGILLDIPTASLVGAPHKAIGVVHARRLQCNKSAVWGNYNSCLETYCYQHRLESKVKRIQQLAPLMSVTQHRRSLNTIDKVLGEGMVHAEKKCRHILAGVVPFSPTLVTAGLLIHLWGLISRHHDGSNIDTRRIRRVAVKCKITKAMSCSLEEAKSNKEKALTAYKKLKRRAHSLRATFLRDKLESTTCPKAQREIRAIIRREEIRRSWRTVNTSRGIKKLHSVSKVEVTTQSSPVVLTEQPDIEEAIMENNSKRFRLASSTPLMQPGAVGKFGYMGETKEAQDILNDNFDPSPTLGKYTNKFLSFVANRPRLPTFSNGVTTKDFQDFWSGARESTASSMSGRHFGHYKAASKNIFLSSLHASIANAASTTGATLDRWTKGMTVMLEKVAGNIKVEKLRAILLMEADFNFMNRLMFGKRLIQSVFKYNRMPQELYGGLANRSAQEVAVNRRLSLDLFRLRRRPGAIAGVDATQCYDRIVHSLASILAQNEGAPLTPLQSMLTSLQRMRYFLRTKFGESKHYYGGVQEQPFQGTAQGNGASPSMWVMISMYLVLLMHDAGFVTQLISAFSGLSVALVGFLFVDDTDLLIFGSKLETAQTICRRLQSMISYWNGILRVSGGALKEEKCYWYLADFVWANGRWSYSMTVPEPIFIKNDLGQLASITYKLPNEATEAVGVWQDLTGSCTKQLQVLIDKIRATHVSQANFPLPRHLSWVSFRQALWRSIDYVLPATTFTKQECATLAKELYRPLLPKLGCNRNFPLLLRYNPPHLWGLDLYNPYWEQGFAKIEILLSHGQSTTLTKHLLVATMEQHQLAVGSLSPLLSLPYSSYHHLTDHSWITSLWQFLEDTQITLINNDSPQLKPLRVNDEEIMTVLRRHNTLTTSEEKSFNRVRCYLEVLTVADIATGDGSTICSSFLKGSKLSTSSKYDWQVECPSAQDFQCWRRLIATFLTPSQVLHKPLGGWIHIPHRQWEWFYCRTSDRVFEKCYGGWKPYRRSTEATRLHPIYISSGGVISIDTQLDYATVDKLSTNSVLFRGSAPRATSAPLPPSLSHKDHEFWVLQHSNIMDIMTASWVVPNFQSQSMLAICDGSFQPALTLTGLSAAWVIETSDQQHRLSGTCCIEGQAADPYRAELLGIYAVLTAILFIERCHPSVNNSSIRIGCDNKGAGDNSRRPDLKVSCKHKHHDLVKAIRVIRDQLRTTTEIYHLYGHQDKETAFCDLDRDAQLNVQVDTDAQTVLQAAHEHSTFISNPSFPGEGWQVYLDKTKVYTNYRHHFRNFLGRKNLREYLFQSSTLSWCTFPFVDFDPLEHYMSDQSRAFCLWYTKHCTNFCGIGKMMKRMHLWNNDLCPCCQAIQESSTTHLFLCPESSIHTLREEGFKSILRWLEEEDTSPDLLHLITSLWFGKIPCFEKDASFKLRKMWAILAELGTETMWIGLLPQGFVEHQQDYYQSIRSAKKGITWASRLVGRILRVTHSLWLHRNSLVHLATEEGLDGMDLIALQSEVKREVNRGTVLMAAEDHHLMEETLDSLLDSSLEHLRGWLCRVKLARGDIDGAVEEGLNDRGLLRHSRPSLTPEQMRHYQNWKNIHLST